MSPGVLDELTSGQAIRAGYLHVGGWALSQARVTCVRIRLDGEPAAVARFGMPWPAVVDEIDWTEAPRCGLEIHLDLVGSVAPLDAVLDDKVTRADGTGPER